MTCAAHGQASGRGPGPYIFARHEHQPGKSCAGRAVRGRPRIGRRCARVEGDGQGVGASDRRAGGKPLSWLAGDLGPPERHALREIVKRGNLAHVNEQAYLVAPVSPATIDALAGLEAEGEDDDEPSIVRATWT